MAMPLRYGLLALMALLAGACANQSPTPVAQAADKAVVLERITGSRTARNVEVRGNQAMTASPVVIIDREDIERSGETNLGDVLRKQPYTR